MAISSADASASITAFIGLLGTIWFKGNIRAIAPEWHKTWSSVIEIVKLRALAKCGWNGVINRV